MPKKVFFYLINFFVNWLTKTLTFRVCLRHLRNNIPVSSFGCNAKLKGKLVELADIFFLPHCQHNLHSCHFNICSYVWIPRKCDFDIKLYKCIDKERANDEYRQMLENLSWCQIHLYTQHTNIADKKYEKTEQILEILASWQLT